MFAAGWAAHQSGGFLRGSARDYWAFRRLRSLSRGRSDQRATPLSPLLIPTTCDFTGISAQSCLISPSTLSIDGHQTHTHTHTRRHVYILAQKGKTTKMLQRLTRQLQFHLIEMLQGFEDTGSMILLLHSWLIIYFWIIDRLIRGFGL